MTLSEKISAEISKRLDKHTVGDLCEMYELLNGKTDLDSAEVRGALMDELDRRNPEAFDRWIMAENAVEMETPRIFFC